MVNLKLQDSLQIYVDPVQQRRAMKLIEAMPEIMQRAYERGAQRFGKLVLQIVKKAMATGIPPKGAKWAPLSDKTLKAYKSWGYSGSHPWFLIGQMWRQVNLFTNKRYGTIYVGFKQGLRASHPNPATRANLGNRYTLARLARMLETGDGTPAPPRPLFSPAFKEAGGGARLNKFIVEELRKELKKYNHG